QTAAILERVPQELRSAQPGASARWIGDPVALHRLCEMVARRLIALPAGTPSLRLLADKTADAFTGIAQALNALALLVADPARPIPGRGGKHIRVPDWLPALVNGGRAFVVIGSAAVFWGISAWRGGN